MASAEDQLKHEFRGEHWIVTDGGKSGFGARFSDRTFGVVQPGGHIIEMPFSYVKRVEVHRTYASTSKSTGGLSLTGALVGGALLGPAGMLLGGTTGKRTTKGKDYLTNLWIQIDMWGPGGGGAESFFLLKSGGPMFSETIMVKAEQVAAQPHANSATVSGSDPMYDHIDRISTYAALIGRGAACGVDVSEPARRVGVWLDRVAPPGSTAQQTLLPMLTQQGQYHAQQQSAGRSPDDCATVARAIARFQWP